MSLFDQMRRFFIEPEVPEEKVDPMLLRAILLLEAAAYDDDLAQDEEDLIKRILVEKYGMGREEIPEFFQLARQKRDKAADIYRFTREMNACLSTSEKMELMTEIWQVILIDDYIHKHEDLFARKLQKLLKLGHQDWIQTKLDAKALIEGG